MDKNFDIDLDKMLLAIEVIKQYEGEEFVKKAQKIIDSTLDYLWKKCEKATSDPTGRVRLNAFSSLVICHGATKNIDRDTPTRPHRHRENKRGEGVGIGIPSSHSHSNKKHAFHTNEKGGEMIAWSSPLGWMGNRRHDTGQEPTNAT